MQVAPSSARLPIRSCSISRPSCGARSLDVTFGVPAVSPEERPVRSFVAEARRDPPEVPSIACMAPVEIAAEKLSALTWRVLTRRRGIGNDDPALVRHLHDLAALKHHAADHPAFSKLVTSALEADADRGDSVVGPCGPVSVRACFCCCRNPCDGPGVPRRVRAIRCCDVLRGWGSSGFRQCAGGGSSLGAACWLKRGETIHQLRIAWG